MTSTPVWHMLPTPTLETPTLETLLAPTGVDEFTAAVHDRRTLYRAGTAERYRDIFSLDDFEELLLTLTSPAELRWLEVTRGGDGLAVNQSMLDKHGMLSPMQVFGRFARGYSLVLNQVHRRSMRVRRVCRDLEREVHAIGDTLPLAEAGAIAFLTPPGQRTLRVHWDAADVIVLHISGRKRWGVWPRVEPAPVRPRGGLDLDRQPPTEALLLSPGDLLYLPAGVPHAAMALPDEHSLHLSINLPAVTRAAVLERAIDSSGTLGRLIAGGQSTPEPGDLEWRLPAGEASALAEAVRRSGLATAPTCRTGVIARLAHPPANGNEVHLLPANDAELVRDGGQVTVLCRGGQRTFTGPQALAVAGLWANGWVSVGDDDLPADVAVMLVAMGIAEWR